MCHQQQSARRSLRDLHQEMRLAGELVDNAVTDAVMAHTPMGRFGAAVAGDVLENGLTPQAEAVMRAAGVPAAAVDLIRAAYVCVKARERYDDGVLEAIEELDRRTRFAGVIVGASSL